MTSLSLSACLSVPVHPSNSNSAFFPSLPYPCKLPALPTLRFSGCRIRTPHPPAASAAGEPLPRSTELPQSLIRLAASAILILGFGFGFRARLPLALAAHATTALQEQEEEEQTIQDAGDHQGERNSEDVENFEGEESKAFEAWKSKVYPLSVPLRIVALRDSVPPAWIKDFVLSQGKRLRFHLKFHGSLEGIFSDISKPFSKGVVEPKSTAAADIVTIGDSWLSLAIKKSVIEPIQEVEDQEWYKGLSERWKIYLRRNHEGEIDVNGKIWAAPYRWGSIVIAYKKSKFQKHKLAPIEDWADLWQPKLAGKISMINCPREVVGAVLKYMGASYNTSNIDLQVAGGRDAVQKNLASLRNQVRLFDSKHHLKAFGVGDVWVVVGWSSDVLPAAKRMSDVAVMVPKSGTSLWADLWAIPAASKVETNQIGGRVRGPSPLVHQWIEFCLQPARALPFKQLVVPGASPSSLGSDHVEVPEEISNSKPKMDTNLVAGVPPPEILARCEFLEPLSDDALSDYQWLMSSMHKPDLGLIHRIQHCILSTIQTSWLKVPLKGN